jgi:hypothetical protein
MGGANEDSARDTNALSTAHRLLYEDGGCNDGIILNT